MKHVVMVAWTLVLATGTAAAQSVVEVPPAGSFQFRPGLAGQHPRLHFTADDIDSIRARGLDDRAFYLERARSAFGHYTGRPVEIDDGWKHYLFGFWGQFAMCMFWIVEQDEACADTAVDWALHYARDTSWLDDDLVPMDITSGMALTYDILYARLSPSERDELRAALFQAADFIYDEFLVDDYWTSDFQNNHMHNRIHGLAHAAFAVLGDDPAFDLQPHADLALGCTRQLVAWMPDDGSTHEGPGYWDYGRHWVVRLRALVEHVTGEDPAAASPHFANDIWYRIHLITPGWHDTFNIGDAGGGEPGNITAMAEPVARYADARGAAALRRLMDEVPGGFYQHAAWGLLWYDGRMEAEPIVTLPLGRLWPDLDMLAVRSSWDDDATGLVFICGPPGGHKMQQMRDGAWVNVAHDHPDQNHFLLYAHGTMLAEDDGYPREQKLTRSHNTVVIDGEGGPREGEGWYQPFDYQQTAFMQDAFLSGPSAVAAGDASRLYPGAERFVRHLFFVEGSSLVLIDDLVGASGGDHRFAWRLHKDGEWGSSGPGAFRVDDGAAALDVRFLAPDPATLEHAFLPAELTAAPCLEVAATAPATRFVSVLVPQLDGAPAIEADRLDAVGGEAVRLVHGPITHLAGIPLEAATLQVEDIECDGAMLITREAEAVQLAILVRGTRLQAGDGLLLGADRAVDLCRRPFADGVRIEAEAPYRESVDTATIQVGGLVPGRMYGFRIDDVPMESLFADGQGVVEFPVGLGTRRVIELTGVQRPDGGMDGGGDAAADAVPDGGGDRLYDGAGDPGADSQVDAAASDQTAPGPAPILGSCACRATECPVAWPWLLVLLLAAAARPGRR